jgi:hypothetical protein
MIQELKDISVLVDIGDLCNYEERIKEEVEKQKYLASNNGIISEIKSYTYDQQPMSFASMDTKIIFKVRCVCLCRKYFPYDIILLKITNKDKILTASNEFFSGSTTISDILNRLNVNDLAVFIINSVSEFGTKMIGNISLYLPNPMVYRLKFSGYRSDLFKHSLNEVQSLAKKITDMPNYDLICRHLFIDIDGQPTDDYNVDEIYLHFNSFKPIAFYSSVNVSNVTEKIFTIDSDHTIIEMLRNKLTCIDDILRNFELYSHTIDKLSDDFNDIKGMIDEI